MQQIVPIVSQTLALIKMSNLDNLKCEINQLIQLN